ncbi:hypothetical protein [Burkholderia stagnalis]|uniref:hypothetical protein n=1 Tax=Burkholderia stagnalis TaxID=1503054 RepID=UPI0009BEB727|nr:hypothetical protein [Burkholderia stagnalis]
MRPQVLATAVIDARTVRSTSGVDYHLRNILGITAKADIETCMAREKTEAALRIASSFERFTPPAYMLHAAFIHV